jgi:hypothetical protein
VRRSAYQLARALAQFTDACRSHVSNVPQNFLFAHADRALPRNNGLLAVDGDEAEEGSVEFFYRVKTTRWPTNSP